MWYNNLHWGIKLGIGIWLLLGAIVLTLIAKEGGIGVLGILTEVVLGVGTGIGMWAYGAALEGELSWEGLGNAALDSFLASSAIMFIVTGISLIAYLSRSRPVSTAELQSNNIKELSYNDLLPSERAAYDGYSQHNWQGNFPGQQPGIKAGKIFKNDPQVLPKALYREFDINPAIPGVGRDATRFVVSSDYVVYLTRDHYGTFYKIIT